MEDDGSYELNDQNIWDGPFWTTEVHPSSEKKFIVQESKVSGTTVTYSRKVWVASYAITLVFGIFVTAIFMITGFLIGGGEGALFVFMGIVMLFPFAYSVALFRWALKKRARSW